MVFCPEHAKRDQNLKFRPLSETTSVPGPFSYGSPPPPRAPVSLHFNQAGHSINDVLLIPLEHIRGNRDAVRKAREANLIHREHIFAPRNK